MTIKQRLESDMKDAQRAKDAGRLSCIRMVRAQLQAREVALRADRGRDYSIDDEEALKVLAGYAKQRRDSIDSYRAGGRDELGDQEERELAIVNEYLPRQLSEEELRKVVREAVAECGASSAKDLGAVMRLTMTKVAGQADGKLVNQIARELLAAS